jgi:hypothetical protein
VLFFRDRLKIHMFVVAAAPVMAPPAVVYYTLGIKPCAEVVATNLATA